MSEIMADEFEDSAESGRGSLRKNLTWLIGILAGIAGIVATVIALWPDPPFTIEDWAERAEAICDDTSGEMAETAREANDAWTYTLTASQNGTATAADFVATGNLYYKMAGAQVKRAGDLSDIQKPDSEEEQVTEVIRDFRAANKLIYAAADTLRNVNTQNPQETIDRFNAQSQSYNAEVNTVNSRLTTLGAGHCVPPVNAP
ncbi:hypothetical protein NRO40_13075 [Streptomyces changanensis]|uniref:Uncharacterized protein n=3 Tax=Streptomyces TaxID=1883 RepID=A0ABY5N7R7_9ACTN|nr:hypothetical protein [Streptomyces changanensis]UUS31674.1 hypothetical protein NRO40_13075 [Streptomyces changanensis]